MPRSQIRNQKIGEGWERPKFYSFILIFVILVSWSRERSLFQTEQNRAAVCDNETYGNWGRKRCMCDLPVDHCLEAPPCLYHKGGRRGEMDEHKIKTLFGL